MDMALNSLLLSGDSIFVNCLLQLLYMYSRGAGPPAMPPSPAAILPASCNFPGFVLHLYYFTRKALCAKRSSNEVLMIIV